MVSANGDFELGFFSPGSSKNRYLSIRYQRAFETIAWVANRDAPLTISSGMLILSSEGILNILDGKNNIIWSSNSSKYLKNPRAQLLDSGNLVITGDDDSDPGNFLWQSFDFPDNTLLPGMRLGKNLATGLEWSLKSWKSTIDPSPGNFRFELDISGYPQLVLWNGSASYIRMGPWNGVRFSGVPNWGPSDIFASEFVLNEKEVYYKYKTTYKWVLMRISTEPDGQVVLHTWTDGYRTWNPSILLQAKYCDVYARCGEYGSCNEDSLCICLDGFQPKNIKAWSSLNFSEGCVREIPLNCNNKDDFVRKSNMKFPDTRSSSYNLSMNLDECRIKCPENCSCRLVQHMQIPTSLEKEVVACFGSVA
ncbi:G-type lectin S-receptor-like serine/threonine-protein kinase At4g27290 [Apium graveolens]|uniref:G-type lectin S-receptor-like serine/threonine-protein kinase At4g27290 n=1 Tax=Apium graveolens TaxID=4045 RepID=UPI003D799CF9